MRRKFFALGLLGSLTALALAQTSSPLRIATVRAWAGSDMVKQVHIEVKVTNPGQIPDDDSIITIVLTPQGIQRPTQPQDPPVPDSTSPVVLEQEVGHLNPGESRTFDLISPYLAVESFTSSSGGFRVQSVMPNSPDASDVRVTWKVSVHK